MFQSSSGTAPTLFRSAHFGLALWVLLPVLADAQQTTLEVATTLGERGALFALFGIGAVAVIFFLFVARVEDLAFLAPRASRGIGDSVQAFCSQRCRVEGRCPLTGTSARAENCPLWAYVASDVPLQLYGSPFEPAKLPPVEA